MNNIKIKIDNKEVESRLLDLAQRSENLRPLMKTSQGFSHIQQKKILKKKVVRNGKT